MDIYRFFHPHYNPRLLNSPLRFQELGELLLASNELKKAVKRANIRERRNSFEKHSPEFTDNLQAYSPSEKLEQVAEALEFIVSTLSSLRATHKGDDITAMHSLMKEREKAPGWENWAHLLKERFDCIQKDKHNFNNFSSEKELHNIAS